MDAPDLDAATAMDRALAAARKVRTSAHAPYSRFRVGAAVWTEDGRVFAGCNVESASFGLTLCAERSALSAYVAATEEGARSPVLGVAIVTDTDSPTPPCGACRQWIVEWAPDGLVVAEGALAGGGCEGDAGGGGGGGSPPQDTSAPAASGPEGRAEGGADGGADRGPRAPGSASPPPAGEAGGAPRVVWRVRDLIPEAFRGESLDRS